MDIQKLFDCLSESEQADLLQFSVMRLQKLSKSYLKTPRAATAAQVEEEQGALGNAFVSRGTYRNNLEGFYEYYREWFTTRGWKQLAAKISRKKGLSWKTLTWEQFKAVKWAGKISWEQFEAARSAAIEDPIFDANGYIQVLPSQDAFNCL